MSTTDQILGDTESGVEVRASIQLEGAMLFLVLSRQEMAMAMRCSLFAAAVFSWIVLQPKKDNN